MNETFGSLAATIYRERYAHGDEDWADIAKRVAHNVMGAVRAKKDLVAAVERYIRERKLMPGGRYLAQAGRPWHQTSNCFLLRAEDSREGWAQLAHNSSLALMSGGGIGVDYSLVRPAGKPIRRTGGTATGPLALMQMINELGRGIRAGGGRRCLPKGSLVHLRRGLVPIEKVVAGDEALGFDGAFHKVTGHVSQGSQKLVSVRTQCGDFQCTPNHRIAVLDSLSTYVWKTADSLVAGDRMVHVRTGLPGATTKLPDVDYVRPKNATTVIEFSVPQLTSDVAWFVGYFHGNGCVHYAHEGFGKRHGSLSVSVPEGADGVIEKVLDVMRSFNLRPRVRQGYGKCVNIQASSVSAALYFLQHVKQPKRPLAVPDWILCGTKGIRQAYVAGLLDADGCVKTRPINLCATVYPEFSKQVQAIVASLGVPSRLRRSRRAVGRWNPLYALDLVGRAQVQSLREQLGPYLSYKSDWVVYEGAQRDYGVPFSFSSEEPRLKALHANSSAAFCITAIESKTEIHLPYVPVCVLGVEPSGSAETYDIEVAGSESFYCQGFLVHNSAIWAGLSWSHADAQKFVSLKDWSADVRRLKSSDFNFPATLDGTNVSVQLDDEFFKALNNDKHPKNSMAQQVYHATIHQMVKKSEPGFSVDAGKNKGETLRNACTEITSPDDSDICNLSSINMARIESLEEMRDVVEAAIALMLAGTVYSDVPYPKVDHVRNKNRRLGLGLMGLHEWLLVHGKQYGPDPELEEYLKIYATSTEIAEKLAEEWELSAPVKTRAVAPNGCQSPDTLVVTEDGIFQLGELVNVSESGALETISNLRVFQETKHLADVSGAFCNGEADIKRILLSSGAELNATPNHKYRVLRDTKYVWVEASSIHTGDLLVVPLGLYQKTTEPPLLSFPRQYRTETKDCVFPKEVSPKLAWFLGAYYADGSNHTKGIRIACNAHDLDYKEVAEQVRSLFHIEPTFCDNGRGCMYVCVNSARLLRWLAVNGLLKPEATEMSFPPIVRQFSADSLRAFVEGYWFGDGSESKSARFIDTVSKTFAQQLVTVIRSLGSDSWFYTNTKRTGAMSSSAMYRVYWVKTQRRCVTSSVRKSLDNLNLKHCVVDEVREISDGRSMTMDIEVPENRTYIANGYVSHNTISLVAETTSGIEPIFCVAYKRRYLKGDTWHYQMVVDPSAKRLIEGGISPENIEDAYTLAQDVERRVAFQVWVQQFVDHAISSTINLPAWGSEHNNEDTEIAFGKMLLKYLPKLRGITCYADGSRGGQPLTPVAYRTAMKHAGEVFEEAGDVCSITKGGVCGE